MQRRRPAETRATALRRYLGGFAEWQSGKGPPLENAALKYGSGVALPAHAKAGKGFLRGPPSNPRRAFFELPGVLSMLGMPLGDAIGYVGSCVR